MLHTAVAQEAQNALEAANVLKSNANFWIGVTRKNSTECENTLQKLFGGPSEGSAAQKVSARHQLFDWMVRFESILRIINVMPNL